MNKHKTSDVFDRRLRSTRSFACQNLMTFKYANATQEQYLYLMVSKKYGNAIQRNQLKRWLRVLHCQLIRKYPGLGLMVKPMKSQLTFEETKLCFQKLILRLQEKTI